MKKLLICLLTLLLCSNLFGQKLPNYMYEDAKQPMLIQAQDGGTYTEGFKQGEMTAEGSAPWLLGGCCLGPVGVIAAAVITPVTPEYMLIGKSPEYVMGFNEGYKTESIKKNTGNAIVGCITSTVFYLFMLFITGTTTPLTGY